MRAKLSVMVTMGLLIASLAVPKASLGKHVTAFGSLTISRCTDQACAATAALTSEVVVFAVTANPGLEKTMNVFLQGPPFTFPVFVNGDNANPGNGDLDTIVVITDLTGSGLTVNLSLRDQGGNPIALTPNTVVIPANGTGAASLTKLLP